MGIKVTDCTTQRRPWMIGHHANQKRAVLFRPRCRLWSCPFCATINRGLWAVRAFNGAESLAHEGLVIDFLTLTSHERLKRDATLAVFPHAWKNLSMRARRAADRFDYMLIPEAHEDGRLHVHAIETAALGSRWWKNNARACGMGYIAEESEVRTPQGAAAYVVKYVTKSLDTHDWPDRFRRVRCSREWPPLPDLPPLQGWSWEMLRKNQQLEEVHAQYQLAGYDVQIMNSNEAWLYIQHGVIC